jgi:hypothetical protein
MFTLVESPSQNSNIFWPLCFFVNLSVKKCQQNKIFFKNSKTSSQTSFNFIPTSKNNLINPAKLNKKPLTWHIYVNIFSICLFSITFYFYSTYAPFQVLSHLNYQRHLRNPLSSQTVWLHWKEKSWEWCNKFRFRSSYNNKLCLFLMYLTDYLPSYLILIEYSFLLLWLCLFTFTWLLLLVQILEL